MELPRATVVFKLELVHHDNALFYWTRLGALAAPDAVLVVDIVQAIGRGVEALVGALQPAQGTLGTQIKAHYRTHSLGSAAFELRVTRLSTRAYRKATWHRRACRTLPKLVRRGQDRYLMGPLDTVTGGHCVQPVLHRLVGLIGGADAVLFMGLVPQIVRHGSQGDDLGVERRNSPQDALI